MPARGEHLSDRDREALRLAHLLREQMAQWLSRRGVTATPVFSPYIDRSGQPYVLVRMNAELALAMILSFHESSA